MGDIWEIISVLLLSTVKFVLGSVPLALGLGFPFLKSFIVTSAGGFLGVFIFVNSSEYILLKWQLRKHESKSVSIKNLHEQTKSSSTQNEDLVLQE